MLSPKRQRLIILGLDGLPHSLVRDLTRRYELEGLSGLLRMASSHPLRSDLPEMSPVNWTSFFTASGPQTHGIFGFTEMDPYSYRIHFTDSQQIRCETVFEELGRRNLFSKSINVPHTYPAWRIHGMMISGFPAADLSRAAYPGVLASRLASEGYKLEADTRRGRQDTDRLLSELHSTLHSRRRALDLLWPDLAFDLFLLVLTEMDRLGHFFFPSLLREEDPWHFQCLEVVRHLDGLICEILERYHHLPEPKRLLALADHGFAELITEVDVNARLREAGLLHTRGEPEHELDASLICPSSKAFALDPGRIYLHRRDRYRHGCLSPAEAESLRPEIASALSELQHEGEPVLEGIFRGEELYPDCSLPHRPDLVCLPRRGFELKAKLDRGSVFGQFGRTGTHTADDAFFADSAGSSPSSVRGAGGQILDYFLKPENALIT